jgi:hypothetical protein
LGGGSRRISNVRPAQTTTAARPYLKKENKNKRVRDMVQVVECLLGMCKALSLIPSTAKNKQILR